VGDEQFISVSDMFTGAAVFTKPLVKEDGGEFLCSHVGFARSYLNVHTQSVCHCDDGVESIASQEWSNEVNHYGVKMFVRDWQWV